MVKVGIAGAGSALGREVIDILVEGGQHEIVALVRKDPANYPQQPNVNWIQISYEDKSELVKHLRGVDVVLNFIVVNEDAENTVGKFVIDAAVAAGVKRYAPSEWATGQKLRDAIDSLGFYRSKLAIQEYLEEINKDRKVIEYTLFQPGIFLDYLGHPHKRLKYLYSMDSPWLVRENRIVSVKGSEDKPLTFTAARDIGRIVRRAIEYEGEWPQIGGIMGNQVTPRQLKQIVQRVTGKPTELQLTDPADLEAGVLAVDLPVMTHPAMTDEMRTVYHVPLWVGMLRSTALGAWTVSDEWNKIFPDYKFVAVEDYIKEVWGKQK
ncbi:hypothetical protein FOWG_09159 [Fusarium oxysporum f. sp. lycopersici MN25]|nr:hypothetical protein FOWG_09159 [Fusarium oxysporum f. sp. lycopersici MN25]